MTPAPLQLNTPDDATLPVTGDDLTEDLTSQDEVNQPAAGGAASRPLGHTAPGTVPVHTGNGKAPVDTQPYEFDQCTITIGIQLLPGDGDPGGRLVVLGV